MGKLSARHYREVVGDATAKGPDASDSASRGSGATHRASAGRDRARMARSTRGNQDDRLPLRRRIRRWLRGLARTLVARIGPFVLRQLSRTWKVTILGDEHLAAARSGSGGHFMALWHGRMLVALPHHAGRDWYVLVSPSQDGDISEALLQGFGYRVIRGSSSRGGARALREMLAVLERGAVLAVTPDGPRGPRHSTNPGLAWMARVTGFAIVPCGFVCDRAWHARSWDRFTVPKPGARLAFVYDAPVRVDRHASSEAMEAATEQVRAGMMRAEKRGFEQLNKEPDW